MAAGSGRAVAPLAGTFLDEWCEHGHRSAPHCAPLCASAKGKAYVFLAMWVDPQVGLGRCSVELFGSLGLF